MKPENKFGSKPGYYIACPHFYYFSQHKHMAVIRQDQPYAVCFETAYMSSVQIIMDIIVSKYGMFAHCPAR